MEYQPNNRKNQWYLQARNIIKLSYLESLSGLEGPLQTASYVQYAVFCRTLRTTLDLVKENQGMRNASPYQTAATAFVIRTLHNPNSISTVTGFETLIETINDGGEINTAFADIIQEGDKIVECKSWELNGIAFQKFVEGTSGSVQQFKTYLSDQTRVTSMDKLEYWFDSKKGVNAPQVKEKFKLMMYNNGAEPGLTPQGLQVFDSIWGNLALRSSIWNNIPVNPNKADYQSRFAAIAADSNNSFYNFIKVK
ncbi:hypothetical protein [Runella limosa]|uniref:hypothetical protein n=1 Tax=Runella limosa TaxID=370978 RepID=UPI0004916372|nr:hypothetical protein [Runella limosa]